ncbi:hypothetical protein AB1N83_013374 [Pleurotus pulmonarius]
MAHTEQPPFSYFSNLLNREQVDMKIQSLRLQVAQISDEIRSLEEYRNNRYLPVSKLPPEVLSSVFESLVTTSRKGKLCSEVFSATKVCCLWRQVALNSPRIWGVVYCSAAPLLVELCLERSKSAPLCLLRGPSSGNAPVNVPKILNHLHRLKKIELDDCKAEWLSRIISQGAPQLRESLSLNTYVGIETFVIFDTCQQFKPADLKLFEGLVKVSKRKTKRRAIYVS